MVHLPLGLSLARQFARSESPRSPLSPPRSTAILTNESQESSSMDSLLRRQQQHDEEHAESVPAFLSCGPSVVSTPICIRTFLLPSHKTIPNRALRSSYLFATPPPPNRRRCSMSHAWSSQLILMSMHVSLSVINLQVSTQNQQPRPLLCRFQVRHRLGGRQPSLVSQWCSSTRCR